MGCGGSKPEARGNIHQRSRARRRRYDSDRDETDGDLPKAGSSEPGSDESYVSGDSDLMNLRTLDRDLKTHEIRLRLKRLLANQCDDPPHIYRRDPELRSRTSFLDEITSPPNRSSRLPRMLQWRLESSESYTKNGKVDTWDDYRKAVDLIEDLPLKSLQDIEKRTRDCTRARRPACKFVIKALKRARFAPHQESTLRARVDDWFVDWEAGAELARNVDWAVMDWDDWRALTHEQGVRR